MKTIKNNGLLALAASAAVVVVALYAGLILL
jgi:hypothetical protein